MSRRGGDLALEDRCFGFRSLTQAPALATTDRSCYTRGSPWTTSLRRLRATNANEAYKTSLRSNSHHVAVFPAGLRAKRQRQCRQARESNPQVVRGGSSGFGRGPDRYPGPGERSLL